MKIYIPKIGDTIVVYNEFMRKVSKLDFKNMFLSDNIGNNYNWLNKYYFFNLINNTYKIIRNK